MTDEPPPNEWTPVVGSLSPEVSNGTSTSVVYRRVQAPGRRAGGVEPSLGQLLAYGTVNEQDWTSKLSEVARRIGLDEREILLTVRSGLSAGRQNPRRLNFLKRKIDNPAVVNEDPQTSDLTIELSKLRENDTDNALRFATRNADRVLYTPGKG